MKPPNVDVHAEKPLVICFTPAEVAGRWKCSASFVRRLIDNGELSAFRAGGKLLRVREPDLLAYEQRQSTSAKIAVVDTTPHSADRSAPVLGLDAAIKHHRQRAGR
ncbi:helix-turn-helix domain-containing protein [Methylobacterium sp. WL30]|nr:helix-turn-helix domain-containing protein [Methylobacterium sp. WL93]TXN49805.1 helix-turn-helix domain-containing protein [Methylobacterium sp. WL119]TXN62767.1 helix-turn-helix domain-containing protein [Methylobacterium sp. WL30]